MVRFSFLAILALSFVGLSLEKPLEGQAVLSTNDGTVHTSEGWSYTDCGQPTDPVEIQSILVSPDPPQPGQDLTVTVKGTAKTTIEEGAYADVTVKLGLIKILQKSFDVCQEARNANASVQCPVAPDQYTVSQTVTLPKEIPRAKFSISVQGYTVDDEDMFCLDLKVDFLPKRPFFRLGL